MFISICDYGARQILALKSINTQDNRICKNELCWQTKIKEPSVTFSDNTNTTAYTYRGYSVKEL